MDEMVYDAGVMPAVPPMEVTTIPKGSVITKEQLTKWNVKLNEYKAGKASVDRRIQAAEKWWKLRNFEQETTVSDPKSNGFRSQTAWLHNVIVNKLSDAIEAYPSANFLPREEADKSAAWALSQVVPAILDENEFEETYDEVMQDKMKTGTGVYHVLWDKEKHNGLGDISVVPTDVLNLFWEPGIKDIQKSRMLFHVEMVDKELIKEMYPEVEDKALSTSFTPSENPNDDTANMADKAPVVDVYYKKRGQLHYCKYVSDVVIYASEEDPERQNGFYEHGEYPFVFDVLFPVKGSPCGYGYVDICWNSQSCIDFMDTAILRNTMAVATPRYFVRSDGGINEAEFTDLEKTLVHTTGNLGDDSLRVMDARPLSGNYINALNNKINELRETSGNTETSTGAAPSGVTAAAAIVALQEASSKGSRRAGTVSYRAYKKVIKQIQGLLSQFYTAPRYFRIMGTMGQEMFLPFDNRVLQPQPQGMVGGMDMGLRVPEFDIEVVPQKQPKYTKLAQNELAQSLYGMRMFDPANAEQALMCLNMMDFDGKEELMGKIAQNGTLLQKFMQMQQLAFTLASQHEPELAQIIAMDNPMMGNMPSPGQAQQMKSKAPQEDKRLRDTRQRVQESPQPGGEQA